MKHEAKVCPSCNKTSSGEFCAYCGARLTFEDGKVVEAHVEGSNHDEVANVVETLKEREGGKQKWSDYKRWVMGMVGTVIVAIILWSVKPFYSELVEEGVLRIVQIQPIDGEYFDDFTRPITLEWDKLLGTSRYIIEVEIQDPGDGKWYPRPNGGRLVTTDTIQSLEFTGTQPARWKVSALDAKEDAIGESAWWYFSFKVTPSPSSSDEPIRDDFPKESEKNAASDTEPVSGPKNEESGKDKRHDDITLNQNSKIKDVCKNANTLATQPINCLFRRKTND